MHEPCRAAGAKPSINKLLAGEYRHCWRKSSRSEVRDTEKCQKQNQGWQGKYKNKPASLFTIDVTYNTSDYLFYYFLLLAAKLTLFSNTRCPACCQPFFYLSRLETGTRVCWVATGVKTDQFSIYYIYII